LELWSGLRPTFVKNLSVYTATFLYVLLEAKYPPSVFPPAFFRRRAGFELGADDAGGTLADG
jgi:hypothetical protein